MAPLDQDSAIRETDPLRPLEARQWSTVIGSQAGIDGSNWILELAHNSALGKLRQPILRLASDSEPSNLFFEPNFVEPAVRHLGNRQINFICLYEITGQHRELKFFAPATITRCGLRRHRVLRIWSHPYAPLSSPLVAGKDFERTVSGFVNCIENASPSRFSAILFQHLPKADPFASAMFLEPRLSQKLVRHAATSRAAILGRDGLHRATALTSGKRRQRLNKARQRLEEHGAVNWVRSTDIHSTKLALQMHLALEDKCWKGKKGTSILKDPDATAFTESAVKNLAADSECTIHALTLDEVPVASMILFHQNGQYFPWKIAFDEDYAKFSVGNLLNDHVNGLLAEDKHFRKLDSLASELNNTARRFWPDELELSNMVIGLGQYGSRTALQIAAELDLLSSSKRSAKRLLGRSL